MFNRKFLGLGLFVATGLGLLFYSLRDADTSMIKYIGVLIISFFYGVGILNHIKELKN